MCALKKKKSGIEDDDRNLVLVDGDFSEADLDDRAWLIWERYKKAILIGGVSLFVAGVAAILWNSLRASHAESVGAEYNAATTPADKMSFAEKNRGEALAVFAALEAADDAYKGGDLKTAGARYAGAVDLANAARPVPRVLLARAVVGRAVCGLRSGDAGAEKQLADVAEDKAQTDGLRAHAFYLLSQNACGAKNFAAAKKYLDRIDLLQDAGPWRLPDSPRSALITAFPELLTAAEPAKK